MSNIYDLTMNLDEDDENGVFVASTDGGKTTIIYSPDVIVS